MKRRKCLRNCRLARQMPKRFASRDAIDSFLTEPLRNERPLCEELTKRRGTVSLQRLGFPGRLIPPWPYRRVELGLSASECAQTLSSTQDDRPGPGGNHRTIYHGFGIDERPACSFHVGFQSRIRCCSSAFEYACCG